MTSVEIQWSDVPELSEPVFVAAFHGWSDAGSVATDTLAHLSANIPTETIATWRHEHFTDYTLDRPVAVIRDGLVKEMEPSVTRLEWAREPSSQRDLILLSSREPHLNWGAYAKVLNEAMRKLNVKRAVTIGGVQDTISHSAPPRISVVATSASSVDKAMALDSCIQRADYNGPISIHTRILQSCAEEEVECMSLWGHAPAYLQRNPRLVAKIIGILNSVAEMRCPIDSLIQKSLEQDRRITEALADDPNLRSLVETIERSQDLERPAQRNDNVIRLNDFIRRDTDKDPSP